MTRTAENSRPARKAIGIGFVSALLAVCDGCAASRVKLPEPPRPMMPAELARWAEPPAPAPDVPRKLPLSVSRFRLESGLSVTVVARPSARSTAITLHVPSMRDPSNGPVAIMADALRAGTLAPGGEVLVNPRLAGAQVAIRTERTGTTFSWEVLSRASSIGVKQLAAFVLTPAFNPPDVVNVLHQEMAKIQRYSSSRQRMNDIVHAAIPGLERATPQADARNLLGMNRDRLRRIHACAMRPEGAELVVVGPVTAEEVKGWSADAFGRWPAGQRADDPACAGWLGPVAPAHPEQARLARAQLQVIFGDFDPVVIVSVPGPAPESDDYLIFHLLAQVVAERATGPAKAFRHMGATYGIHAETDASYAHFSMFDLEGQIEPSLAKDALRAMVTDLRQVADNLQAPEIANVSRRWRDQLVQLAGSNMEIAGLVRWQLRRGRDVEALPDVLEEIERIDYQRCRDVARRYLSTVEPSIGVMGLPNDVVRGLGLDVQVQYAAWTSEAPAGESF